MSEVQEAPFEVSAASNVVRKAGRLGALLPVGAPQLKTISHYATGASLPVAPPSFKWGSSISEWGMLCNDRIGCCTISAVGHALMAYYAEVGQSFPIPSDAVIESTYFGLTGGPDTGLVETTVLSTWEKTGLFNNKIAHWIPVDIHNEAEVRSALYVFGTIYIGVTLPQSAEIQFESGNGWTVVPGSPIIGGHAVLLMGSTENEFDVITWGAEITATYDWLTTYTMEAYVILPEVFITSGRGPLEQLDLALLESDYATLGAPQ